MSNETRIVAAGPKDGTLRTTDGQILHAPADGELLPPGDTALTRRVKTAGPTWTVQEKRGPKTCSQGVWAPVNRIAAIRAELEAERWHHPCEAVSESCVNPEENCEFRTMSPLRLLHEWLAAKSAKPRFDAKCLVLKREGYQTMNKL